MLVTLFCLLSGLSAAVYSYVFIGVEWWVAALIGLADFLCLRGLFSYFRRWLVLHEHVADTDDIEERTTETNRYLFWRRAFFIGILAVLYLFGAGLFGVSSGDALAALPGLLLNAIITVAQLMLLMVANFALFFGPFLLFGRMGREYIEPGDANYEVAIEDVRGQKSAVEEMKRILRLFEQGRNFVKAGGKRERGVLMVGPPGTGKTMLAKGIASSLQVPIVITSGASLQGMFLGMDMVAVFMTVRAAKKKARRWGGCVIFIDEFDALGSRRSGMGGGPMGGMGGMFGGGQLGLNMLLVQMDGVDNPGFVKKAVRRFINVTLDGLFIPRQIGANGSAISLRVPRLKPPRFNLFFVGATNRPSVLDEAVTRPGRFGRQIIFRMPTRESRKDIADLYFAKKKHEASLDTPEKREEFARVTEGYSPAMIEQALSIALMYAFEEGRDAFTWRDLREAMGNIEIGLVEPVEYSERDKVAVARHELGHVVASHFFEPQNASVRLSIRMRGGSLGHHYTIGKEEQFTHFRSEEAGRLRAILGALAAERVFYGENSSGVTGDLMQATNLVSHMVAVWGMGPEALSEEESRTAVSFGQYLFSSVETMTGILESGSIVGSVLGNPVARRTAAQILGAAFIDDWRLMNVNKEAIDLAAEALIAQSELMGDEVTGLLDSVHLRMTEDSDPYPQAPILVPSIDEKEPSKPARARPA